MGIVVILLLIYIAFIKGRTFIGRGRIWYKLYVRQEDGYIYDKDNISEMDLVSVKIKFLDSVQLIKL